MSFNINSDKEFIRGINPKLIGDNELTIRGGTGSLEREILRTELDSNTGLPRVGINRTGQRINNIDVDSGGSGYTVQPSVTVDPPTTAGGVQATATAFIFNGRVTSIAVNNPGSGYTQSPTVVISGGGGIGATATAFLDTVDFELDINGAIRTSTSIISDTARILNLDIDNFVTPDLNMRGPNFKTYVNNTGIPWANNVIVQENAYRYFGANVYQALNSGETGSDAPEHTDGIVQNGQVNFKHIGFRVVDPNAFAYNETGDAGIYPRSITPLLGDRSDKIATTEYVLNLATNDVGGRIYVSQQIGSDLNDGRSAVNPVRTIKKAAQLAWATPGVKETLIVSGGDYVEDNPISLPPDASVVGDNLRLVIIRPANPGKHIFKFGDKNYVTGVTYRDQIDSNGDSVATWDFAMVFDDKQRVILDYEVNGDFGVEFPIGHQIFGPDEFEVGFQQNTGLSQLTTGLEVIGVNTGARANVIGVDFDTTTGASAYINGNIDVRLTSGSFVEGEQFRYIVSASQGAQESLTFTSVSDDLTLRYTNDPSAIIPPGSFVNLVITPSTGSPFSGFYEVASIDDDNSPSYWDVTFVPILNSRTWTSTSTFTSVDTYSATTTSFTFDSVSLKSIRAEGEVVSIDEDLTATVPIQRIDFSQQGSAEVATGGFQSDQFGNAEDLGGIVFYTQNPLVGRQNTHEFKEGQEITIAGLPTSNPDLSFLNGKQRIYKVLEDADGRSRRFVIPKKVPSINDANFDPGQFATASTYSRSVTLSLLNSPNTFPLSTPVDRRYQDACTFIRNNRDFIADEVVGRINDEFKKEYFSVYDVSGNDFKIYLGTSRFEHIYDSANPTGTITFGGIDYSITDFIYDASVTGVATVTTSIVIPGLSEDDTVKLSGLEVTCSEGTKVYPSFNIPVSDEQCKQDIVHFLNALIRDLEFGSNHNIIEAAEKYIVGAKIDYVENEIIQTVRAIEYARELAIYAMCNWRTGDRTPASDVYVPQYSTITRYFDDSVITSTALLNADGSANGSGYACDDVRSAIDTLAYLWVDVISNDASGTYLDAAYLIARNRDLIADQALIDTEASYPTLNLSDIHQRKCRRDVNFILSGLIRDLVLGGNTGIVTAAEAYFSGATLTGIDASQLDETIFAYQRVAQYAKDVVRNWTGGNAISTTPTSATYDSSTGAVTVTILSPATIPDTNDRIAFAEEALTFNCASNGGGDLASPGRFDSNFGQSYPITNVVDNGGTITISCTVPNAGTAAGIAHTFVSAKADATILIYDPVTTTSPIPKFEDWNILLYGTQPLCSNVTSSIDTAMGLLEDILDGTIVPGSTTKTTGTLLDTSLLKTYPDSYVYDQNNQRMSIRGIYDDYPIIEASPYTQNASVISFLGGGGAEVDGNKVKQPNCPFPGLELDGSASFPNQGKSMVAAAFTIVSFGGTGYKILNDGYTQLVSVFVIFCADGVLAETGGYASITNSATNFGQYALRATGYREEAYEFDVAQISNVSATPTGRTILTVTGLGREPLEHYVVKVDGYENTNPDIEYFIDAVSGVTVGPPFSAQITLDDGTGGAMNLTDTSTGQAVSTSILVGKTARLHRPSIVNSSSHTWEFAGSGINYLALPENGGTKVEANEQVSENYGRVYVSGTDELGDFKVGTFAKIENRTGAITFTGTVTISEVEFLKLKGGDVVVTGFDASNTLGGANSSDSKIPTQKAVRDYIVNNLGAYINKPYSTNAIPRNLVELTDSGKISIDQIPALRPFSVYTVADQSERLSIEGALAGDIAIQQDTSTSFILNNDLDSQFLAFQPDPTLQFTIGDIFSSNTPPVTGPTGVVTVSGRIQATEYRTGVVYQITLTDGGSGYVSPPTVSFSGGSPGQGAIAAAAVCTIANGEVVTITLVDFNGYIGGKGYTTAPTVTISAPPGAGTQAQANCLIESRLYGNIVNQVLFEDGEKFNSSDIPAVEVTITRAVNTSASDNNNWVSLSSNQIAASDITSGVIETDRLASGGSANSFTFLRGDQNFALAVQSFKGPETRYFALLYSTANSGSSQLIFQTNSDVLLGHEVVNSVTGIPANTNISGVITAAGLTTVSLNNPITSTITAGTLIEFDRGSSPLVFESPTVTDKFIDDVIIISGGSGYSNGSYFNVPLDGGAPGVGLRANITVSGNSVTEVIITDAGSGYSAGDFIVTSDPAIIGSGSGLVLAAKVSTVAKQHGNISMDIQRVSSLTVNDPYGTVGVARFKKDQFNIAEAGNGSIELKTGADSGLDADLLDGAQGSFYTNASNMSTGTLPTDRLAGTYPISISGSSARTIRLDTGTNNPTSNPSPNNFVGGVIANTINNSADLLVDGGSRHLVLTLRNGGSGFDATFGGVRQLAFTDNDNMYLRGSGTGVTAFGSWAKVWTSLNDGAGSDLDADRLDNKQGEWYQNALNINYGTLSDTRLPRFISSTVVRDSLSIKSFNGDPRYDIYISGSIQTSSPFTPGNPVKLYDANSQGVGDFTIDNIIVNDDVNDNFNDYTILRGRLTSGNFIGAINVGTASISVPFQDFTIQDGNTIQVAELESDGGTANLRLGRTDGNSSSPGIYFNSSTQAANYNASIVASGGSSTDGSGTLNVTVADADSLQVKGSVVWNAGNTDFTSSNGSTTYDANSNPVLRNVVMRDGSGNFAAGTITADLTGTASGNVDINGDTMTGALLITNVNAANQALSVSGRADFLSNITVAKGLTSDAYTVTSVAYKTLKVDSGEHAVGIGLPDTVDPAKNLHVRDGGLITGSNPSLIFNDDDTNATATEAAYVGLVTVDGSILGNSLVDDFALRAPNAGRIIFGISSGNYNMVMGSNGTIGMGTDPEAGYALTVSGKGKFTGGLRLDDAGDNGGTQIEFLGAKDHKNFRIGNALDAGSNIFEITSSNTNGAVDWKTGLSPTAGNPAIAIQGGTNRVAINTTSFSGVDTSTDPDTTRNYALNVNGDVNIDGNLFQNNEEFVTSRWTESSDNNGANIYRQSFVGINKADPAYALDVSGDIAVTGTVRANGDPIWLDTYGVIKANRNNINEDVIIPANTNASSNGPLEINSGKTITITSGSTWTIN